jgi:TonB family protein
MDMVDDRVNEHINTQDAAVDAHIGTQDHHSDVDENDVVIPEDTHNNSSGTLTDGGDDDAPHINVEEMPEFPGGEQALMQYVAKHIIYPQDAKEIDIDGKVIVRFVVERNGSVDEVQIARGVYRSLDSEAKRVIQSMPVWKPGKQNGRPVRVLFTMPIVFHIGR